VLGGSVFASPRTGGLLGWPLVLAGAALCWWAVLAAGEMSVAAPNALLTTGPYAFSRNPMYVGWALIYAGIAFAANSLWLLVLLPFIAGYVHIVDIRKEERFLERKFGETYLAYKSRVRPYL
jgi:protein-S-isoprenylcysteine O-methyltransferase Ste14